MQTKLNIKIPIAVIIIITIVFSSVLYANKAKATLEHGYHHGEVFAFQAQKSIKMYIDEQLKILHYITNDEKIIEVCIDPESKAKRLSANEYLKEINTLHPEYGSINVFLITEKEFAVDVDGKSVIVTNDLIIADSMDGVTVGLGGHGQNFINEIQGGKPYYISKVHGNPYNGEPVFVISVPVVHEGEVVGVTIIATLMDHIVKEYIDGFLYEETGYLFILDDRTVTIAHRNQELILKEASAFGEEAYATAQKSISGEEKFVANFIGTEKLYFSKKMEFDKEFMEHEWFMVYTQNMDEINGGLKRYLIRLIICGILFIIGAALILKHLSSVFQRSIKKEKLKDANTELEKEIKNRTKDIEKISKLDGLTELYNRETAYGMLTKLLDSSDSASKEIIAIMIDIDFFKNVNDKYGHLNGDIVLKTFAKFLMESLRKEDVIGRYGGEEFIVVMKDIKIKEAVCIIDRMRIELSNMEIQLSEGQSLKITASFGIVRWNGEDIIEFVRKADEMLYKAKENGRNRVEY